VKIHGLVVSVNYADLLEKGIALWMNGLESLTVVTDLEDDNAVVLAQKHGAKVFRTGVFTERGASFNKGAAMTQAVATMPREDWWLIFDADIVPPADWKPQLEAANPQPGFLYGCWRYDERGIKLHDDVHGYGFFQLVHTSDPLAQVDPFYDTHWLHGGNSDSYFMLRWRNEGKLAPVLPLKLIHPGGKSENWWGRGKHQEFEQMQRERMRRGGGFQSIQHERIQT